MPPAAAPTNGCVGPNDINEKLKSNNRRSLRLCVTPPFNPQSAIRNPKEFPVPAGTTLPTRTLDRIIAIAGANSGITAARVARGYTRYADSDNLEALVAALTPETQGYFSAWLKDVTVAEYEVFPARVVGELLIAVPKDTSTDLNATWDFVINFANSLAADANYVPGEAKPSRITFSLHAIDVVTRQGIAIFDFGAYGKGGIEFPEA
jgi:hypothetical protein